MVGWLLVILVISHLVPSFSLQQSAVFTTEPKTKKIARRPTTPTQSRKHPTNQPTNLICLKTKQQL
jgi:hypothetical protein